MGHDRALLAVCRLVFILVALVDSGDACMVGHFTRVREVVSVFCRDASFVSFPHVIALMS